MSFGKLNFSKRRLLLQVIRHIKNGRHPILNYQIVLIVETCLENFRYSHNKALADRGNRGIGYNSDYNETVRIFKAMSEDSLILIIQNSKPDNDQDPNKPGNTALDRISQFIQGKFD